VQCNQGARTSDAKRVRFGIRHFIYELSLFDESGRLRRVDVDLAQGARRGERLIDVRHEALKKSPGRARRGSGKCCNALDQIGDRAPRQR
jgi:hypothetical protein